MNSQDHTSAMETPYPFNAPGKPVFLYEGPLQVGNDNGSIVSGSGQIILKMMPSPRVIWRLSSETVIGSGESHLVLPTLSSVFPVPPQKYLQLIPQPYYREDELNAPASIGDGAHLMEMRFYLINCTLYPGIATLRSPTLFWTGRTSLDTQDWIVDIDARPDLEETWKATVKQRSFVFTHIARIRRRDGSSFDVEDTSPIRDALFWFLSFVRGGKVGQALSVGFDSKRNKTFIEWTPLFWGHPGLSQFNWYPQRRPEVLPPLFVRFWDEWQNQQSLDALRWVIGAYASANTLLESESGLMVAFAGLETLGWINGFNKGNTANRLTSLLRWAKIPIDRLPEIEYIRKKASQWKRSGPETITWVRNRIVHPDKNQELTDSITLGSYVLALWYLELVLLRLFGYQDVYSVRLTSGRWIGEVERVPWVETDRETDVKK